MIGKRLKSGDRKLRKSRRREKSGKKRRRKSGW